MTKVQVWGHFVRYTAIIKQKHEAYTQSHKVAAYWEKSARHICMVMIWMVTIQNAAVQFSITSSFFIESQLVSNIKRGSWGGHRTNFSWAGWLDQFRQSRLYEQSWCSRMEFGWGESRWRDSEFNDRVNQRFRFISESKGWGRGEGRDEETHPWASCQQADIQAVMFCLYGAEAAVRQGASSGAGPMNDGCLKLTFFFFFFFFFFSEIGILCCRSSQSVYLNCQTGWGNCIFFVSLFQTLSAFVSTSVSLRFMWSLCKCSSLAFLQKAHSWMSLYILSSVGVQSCTFLSVYYPRFSTQQVEIHFTAQEATNFVSMT